ncbi:MAG: glycosyltransferase family 2 protein [bacterium]|nr:glycosyltransferase family 2 protein [bacterium]
MNESFAVGITVIIAVYASEAYLRKCLNSVAGQTFTDFECIVVDDGSPDSCGLIADEYAQKDPRFRVIHQQNRGAAAARNLGISIAKGKYLYIMDCDDWLDPHYLEQLYTAGEKHNAQLVLGGYSFEYIENGVQRVYEVTVPPAFYPNRESIRNIFHVYLNSAVVAPQWNKLYRTDYVRQHNVYVPDLGSGDMHFNIKVFKDLERLAVCKQAGYYYFQSRDNSYLNNETWAALCTRRREQIESIYLLYHYWQIESGEILSKAFGYCAAMLVQCLVAVCSSDSSDKYSILKDLLNDRLNRFVLQRGKIASKLLAIAAVPAKMRCVPLCLAVGTAIGFVKKYLPQCFYYLQAVSVHSAKVK